MTTKPVVIWIRPREDFLFDPLLDSYDDDTLNPSLRRSESGVMHDAAVVGHWGRRTTCGPCQGKTYVNSDDCMTCNGHGYFIWWIIEKDGVYRDDTRDIQRYCDFTALTPHSGGVAP